MAFNNVDALIAALPGQAVKHWKSSINTKAAGSYASLWKASGIPGAGANPPAFNAGSGYVPDKTTAGALKVANASAGKKNYIAAFRGNMGNSGFLMYYDRLWACSGLDSTVTTLNTITTPGALTRPDALGADVEIWVDCYTALGVTSRTLTVNYVDQDGNAATTTVTIPVSMIAGQSLPVPLQAGGTGCRQLTSCQLSGSTGTAGNYGLTLRKRIIDIYTAVSSGGGNRDFASTGLPQIVDDACVEIVQVCGSTVSGTMFATMNVCESA